MFLGLRGGIGRRGPREVRRGGLSVYEGGGAHGPGGLQGGRWLAGVNIWGGRPIKKCVCIALLFPSYLSTEKRSTCEKRLAYQKDPNMFGLF